MNPADILKYGHLTVLRSIEDVAEADCYNSGVCGLWSVRDVIGHLGVFEVLLEDVLRTFLGEGDTPLLLEYKRGPLEFNDVQAGLRKDMTMQQVLAEYQDAYAHVAALAPQVPAEKWRANGTLPWYGMEYALEDYIVYGYYGHKREHTAQIDVYKDRLKGS